MGSNPAAPTKKNQYTFVYWFFFVSARDLNRAAVRSTANKAIGWLCLARGSHRLGMSNRVHAARSSGICNPKSFDLCSKYDILEKQSHIWLQNGQKKRGKTETMQEIKKKGTKAMGNNGIELERDGFKSRTGFILACIGSAVGMGNIWRFPYMVSAWGGMTFLIPYVLFVILIGSTGVIEEMALGRATKGGPIKAFGDCMQMRTGKRKAGEAIGFIPVLGSLALAMGYTVVVGWIFKYTYLAFSGKLSAMGNDMSAIGGMFGSTASTFGNNMWLIIAMVVTAVIMALGIAGGIEKANKVMMPLLFIMFVGLGIYIFTLPGSSAGYKYILLLILRDFLI